MVNNNILYIKVQNALRSFAEIAENFPEDLKDGYKLSRALEPTDESGKALSVKEFAKVGNLFGIHRKRHTPNVKNNFLFAILKHGYILLKTNAFSLIKYTNKLRPRYVQY